jgi:hypothetical protein
MTPLIQRAVRVAPEPEKFHWFDIGTMPAEFDLHCDDYLVHLPFDRVAIAGVDANGYTFAFAGIQGKKSITISGFFNFVRAEWIHPFHAVWDDEGIIFVYPDKANRNSNNMHRTILAVFSYFLKSLNRPHKAYKINPQSLNVNRKRIAKGKKPIFTWHTLEVCSPTAKREESAGGTHASPRLHDRRGHWRSHPSGKKVWVKPCKVGNAGNGVVFKDYQVLRNS